jgi:hypothetical protein
MDAERFAGHPYHWGGASNPSRGFDCSSFVSYILGHDMGLPLPGGSWAATTGSGTSHGDTASQFLAMPGAMNMGHNPNNIQPGDLLVWPGHVGFGVGPGRMFSAYSTAAGTVFSPAQASGTMTIMRLSGAGGFGATMPGPITDTGNFGFNFARGGLVGDLGAGGTQGMSLPEKQALAFSMAAAARLNSGKGIRPHSAGGMLQEPIFGRGAFSGLPYSFAENGPEQIVPGGASTQPAPQQPGATQYGQAKTNELLVTMIKLLHQMPYSYAKAMNSSNSRGVQHGHYSPQN